MSKKKHSYHIFNCKLGIELLILPLINSPFPYSIISISVFINNNGFFLINPDFSFKHFQYMSHFSLTNNGYRITDLGLRRKELTGSTHARDPLDGLMESDSVSELRVRNRILSNVNHYRLI